MKVTVITACRNAADWLPETIQSVLNQGALHREEVELEYLVMDGASEDHTLDAVNPFLGQPGFSFHSEPDTGVYDALRKGFERTNGNIVSYLNAGDLLHSEAFSVLAEIFSRDGVEWLTGFRVGCNERAQVTSVELQRPFRQEFFENGFYGGMVFPTVQQESTFWRRELMQGVDWELFVRQRVAGDYLLWKTFARVAPVATVDAHLGTFRHHRGQLSENKELYQREVAALTRPATAKERLTAWLDQRRPFAGGGLLRAFTLPPMRGRAFYFDHARGEWSEYV